MTASGTVVASIALAIIATPWQSPGDVLAGTVILGDTEVPHGSRWWDSSRLA